MEKTGSTPLPTEKEVQQQYYITTVEEMLAFARIIAADPVLAPALAAIDPAETELDDDIRRRIWQLEDSFVATLPAPEHIREDRHNKISDLASPVALARSVLHGQGVIDSQESIEFLEQRRKFSLNSRRFDVRDQKMQGGL